MFCVHFFPIRKPGLCHQCEQLRPLWLGKQISLAWPQAWGWQAIPNLQLLSIIINSSPFHSQNYVVLNKNYIKYNLKVTKMFEPPFPLDDTSWFPRSDTILALCISALQYFAWIGPMISSLCTLVHEISSPWNLAPSHPLSWLSYSSFRTLQRKSL